MQLRLVLGLVLSLLSLQVVGKKDKPDVDETKFDDTLRGIVYFEDSDIVLATVGETQTTYRSEDGGAKWKKIKDVEEGEVMEVMKHPYDKKTAVILGGKKQHWITHDRGETWKSFKSKDIPSLSRPGIAFHASDPKRMIFHAEECKHTLFCEDVVYYTTDGFETDPKLLSDEVMSCAWAKSTDIFTTGDEKLDKDRVLCIAKGKFSFFSSDHRIVVTDDYFESEPDEPVMSSGQTVEGVTNIAAVKKYMVFAAKSERSTEMAMYVSDDTKTWHRAEFGEHRLEEDAYTLLESTNYSMQVDVMTTRPLTGAMGVLLTSNSNGTFFTKNIEHTNRNSRGFVDFEKVSNIQGIVLVNTVENWEEVEKKGTAEKHIVSQISFDDGRTWESMKAGDDKLHLHSVTKQRNLGRIFSSPAPGIVMGVGNTGKRLESYDEGDLFVSSDAGLSWKKALSKPHIYEFGAQGSVLVAVEDGETKVIQWSLDYGKNWEKMELKDKIKPKALTTTPDSTSLRFMLLATKGSGSDTKHVTYGLNFGDLHESECKDKDFEKWPARVDDKGEPTCIMGHVQYFHRRKADAKCLVVSKNFEDPEEDRETCKCTKKDFECDYNFKRDNEGKCVKDGPIIPPEGACEGGKTTFKGSSGYRLIPGNDCKGGEDLSKEVERECKETTTPPVTGEIATEVTKFEGEKFIEYYYLERETNSAGEDETVVMRTDRHEVYKSRDHGKHWEPILKDEKILALYPHQYDNDRIYMITPSEKVFYSKDRLSNVHSFEVKTAPNRDGVEVLSFHPKQKDWLIWAGSRECKSNGDECLTAAEISKNHGDDWTTLLRAVRKCQFVYREDRPKSDDLVYCEQFVEENPEKSLTLLSSSDWFEHKEELKRDVINFATMSEYIVVAIKNNEKETLEVDASIDGTTFAGAKFPPNFHVSHQSAYTVLDSSTHSLFLHVTVNPKPDQEYGSIVKSNSNGTSYVLSISEVNRNGDGYVDFEKMQGIEGVAIVNRVANTKEVDGGKSKKLKTYITHNDGALWDLLPKPQDPPEGKYECSGDSEKCRLHLHGYTERKDPRDTYSSPTAVGMLMGTGNVGEYLGPKKNADTFITSDGGLTWRFAAKGNWMWEYGDMGSVIVIVKEDEPVDYVRYSLDEGATWKEHKFGKEMNVQDITTVPSDTSRNFLLWGKIGGDISTINLDFSSLKERSKQCELKDKDPNADDYLLWSPKHPSFEDNCLFGHVSEYHRKKTDRDCYNGNNNQLRHLHNIAKNCTCTRHDFECDYNYEPHPDGSCQLVKGLEKPDPVAVCKQNPDLTEYNEITGYRRIPLTTCTGGDELDSTLNTKPCPGKEELYKKKHSISGAGLFFAIVIPIAAAAGAGYWVFKNWDGKFGRIQLGDSVGSGYGGGGFDGDAPWIKYPVMLVSGIVAVVAAIPMVAGSLWRTVSTRLGRSSGYTRPYTSRSSFQRGRGDYAIVEPDDEGELLGEDSDEDV